MISASERIAEMKTRAIARIDEIPHGRRHRYALGCRCDLCRKANSAYECERQRARRKGLGNGIVDAGRARAHLLKLRRQGVGRRAVQAATDIADSILVGILQRQRTRIRANTERRILQVTSAVRGDKALISSAATWRLIDELLEEGYTRTRIAQEMGYRRPALQFRRDKPITVRNAERVRRAHRKLTT